jgi:flagellar motor switch protein FliM
VTPEQAQPDAPVQAGPATIDAGEPTAARVRVREVDFRRPSKFPRDQTRLLERAHETFCRSISSSLSARLRTGLELTVTGSDQLPYGTAMSELPDEAFVAVIDVEPIGTQIALLCELPLIIRIVDRMLGGTGKPRTHEPVALSDVEEAIARRAVGSLVESLSALWSELVDVELSLASSGTTPVTVQLVAPSEPTLLLRMEARIDGLEAPLTLCLPHRSLEPVLHRLAREQDRDADDGAAAAAVEAAVHGVEVDLRAEIGAVELSVEEILALSVGDVVPLRRSAAGGVVLHAGDVPAFVARPGRNGNVRAVQVRAPWGR